MKKLWKPALLLAAMLVMAFGMINSGAWFTDEAAVTTNQITAGTLSIGNESISTLELLTIENMAPGDVTDPVEILITNDGNLDLGWFGRLTLNGSDLLKDAIYIKSATMEYISPNLGNWQGTGLAGEGPDVFITDGKGSGRWPSYYNLLASQSDFEVITLANFVNGNPMGVAPYTFKGALKPTYSYKLTLEFGFAEEAGNLYQTRGPLNIGFQVVATQLKDGAVNAIKPSGSPYWDISENATWMKDQIEDQTEP